MILAVMAVVQPATSEVIVHTTVGDDGVELSTIDSTGDTTRIGVARLRRMLSPMAPVPMEDLERLSPEQIERLAKVAIIARRDSDTMGEGLATTFLLPIFIVGLMLLAIVLVVWLVTRHRRQLAHEQHELRLAMVQQGTYDPALFALPQARQLPKNTVKTPKTTSMIIWGLILGLAGVGLLMSEIAEGMARYGFFQGIADGFGDSGFELLLIAIGAALILAAEYVKREIRGRAQSSPTEPMDRYDGEQNSSDVR